MGLAPRHTCARCGRLVRGRCPVCTKTNASARDARRPSASQRGYGAEWATFSQRWLSRFPWCGQRADGQLHDEHSRCVQLGLKTFADCTDHITAIKAGGNRYASANLQSLCTACNVRKGIDYEGGFGRAPKVET